MANDSRAGFRLTPQSVFGLLIIAVGLLLTADNLRWIESESIIRFWPLGVILAGALKFAQSESGSGRLFGGLVTGVGMLLAAEHTFGWPIDVEDWWLPAALIAIGVVVILRARQEPATPPAAGQPRTRHFGAEELGPSPSPRPIDVSGPPAAGAASAESTISEFAVWAGKQRRSASPAFRHADLTAIMGGIELDLRGAATATGEAIIDLFVMWGGIEIWVPPDWAVSNQVGLLMAGAEDKSTGTQAARHRLIVRGFAIMGGVEIKT
jgi:predicted membrane protein